MVSKHQPGERLGRYILEGHKVVSCEDTILWGMWMQRNERHVARTEVRPEIYVSTVFLGLDHNHWDNGPPILFETMVFGPEVDSTWHDAAGKLHTHTIHVDLFNIQERYSTWDEAAAGHERIVAEVRAKVEELEKTVAVMFNQSKADNGK